MKKHIPNMITSLNVVCGIAGVVFAFKGRCDLAFILMLCAGVFDFCDGLAARALGAYSEMGRELDSLCDLVSFGVLPSVMLYNASKVCKMTESWVCWTPLLITVFSALRLAKFNVDPRQTHGFLGLPVPACAIFVGSLCCYVAHDQSCFLALWCAGEVFVPALSVCLSALLVSEIPMFSLKFSRSDDNALLRGKRLAFAAKVVASLAVCFICRLHWSVAPLLVFAVYIIVNVLYRVFKI